MMFTIIANSIYFISLIAGFIVCRITKKRRIKRAKELAALSAAPELHKIPLNVQNAQVVRKQWLWSLLGIMGITLVRIWTTYFAAIANESSAYSQVIKQAGMPYSGMIVIGAITLSLIPSYGIMYHCAYRKSGTAWLQYTLITLPIGELFSLSMIDKGTPPIIGFVVLASIVAEIYYWICSLRLYRLNAAQEFNHALIKSAI